MVADGDLQTAQAYLDASAITVPTGDLISGVYDEYGNFYQMPEHIICDPVNVVVTPEENTAKGENAGETTDEEETERKREEKGKSVLRNGNTIKVKARLSDRGGPDLVIAMGKDQNVRSLIRRIQEEVNVSDRCSGPCP